MPDQNHFVINPSLEVVDLNPATLNIISPAGRFSLRDESGLVPELVRKAKSGLDLARFVADGSERYHAQEIEIAAQSLIEKRILVPASPGRHSDSIFEFLDPAASRSAEDSASPLSWRIELEGAGRLAEHVGRVLEDLGFAVSRPGRDGPADPRADSTLTIACSDHEDFAAFRAVNAAAVAAGRPAYYLSVDRQVVRAGPMVIPHATACIECLFHRVESTRLFHAEFLARSDPGRRLASPHPSLLALQYAAACLSRAVLFLGGRATDLHLSPIHEYDLVRGSLKTSNLLRLPRCPVCGSAKGRPLPQVFQTGIVRRSVQDHAQRG